MNGDCFSRERANLRITVILSGGLSEPYRLAFRASYWRYTLGSKHPVKLVIKTSLTPKINCPLILEFEIQDQLWQPILFLR